jgi:hypothetical protein
MAWFRGQAESARAGMDNNEVEIKKHAALLNKVLVTKLSVKMAGQG